ncbi:hypothetical protein ASPZODRAFT_137468 [Penicilliopsis zonata CBS 506.65]|uniref:Uncharacterized protein n=1 Tax=Penicilliopsis zonata CBS 506.65 TaxID=1073090 RepID=A0A1L9S4R9_9EURO|nr:hypothetical protein ASPZODRAFT_137468 [Penicilliopsis zonata CBS 506.65]OJJ42162.1 hypothetical protein ASPZODRAFT_137468 [Penicilliopsis zonata CBS 506.65]
MEQKYKTKNVSKQSTAKYKKTCNSRDSLVVTHPTTNLPACGLCAADSRVAAARVSLG